MTSNREAYNFWAQKVRARITDPDKRDLLAPLELPHVFDTKRPFLEQTYFDQFNSPHIKVVDMRKYPIREVVENGIITEGGKLHKVDVIALATGFDAVTGGMTNMGLKDINDVDLREKWKIGLLSYLGLTCNGYPNMFFLDGAQSKCNFPAPSAHSIPL